MLKRKKTVVFEKNFLQIKENVVFVFVEVRDDKKLVLRCKDVASINAELRKI